MKELTKVEAIATVEAINTMLNVLGVYLCGNELKDATDTLWTAKSKIEKIYQEHE